MNVQKTIIEGIKHQLFRNDYLVLPNFGGFVLKPQASQFSSSGLTINPPSKTVTFNLQLKQNDGILVSWLQEKLNCTSSVALSHLNDFSEYCKVVLGSRKRLTIEGIGFFYLDFENNVCFEPQQDANFLVRSFGLSPINVQPTEFESIEAKKEKVFVDRTLTGNEITKTVSIHKRNYRILALPLLLFLIFFSGIVFFISNHRIAGELRSSILRVGSNDKVYTPLPYSDITLIPEIKKNETYVIDANGIANIKLEDDKKISVFAFDKEVPLKNSNQGSFEKSALKNLKSENSFEIVLGCFSVLENAKKMVEKMVENNIEAKISGKNYKNMHVVSISHFKSKELAIKRLAEIKETCPKAWIKTPN